MMPSALIYQIFYRLRALRNWYFNIRIKNFLLMISKWTFSKLATDQSSQRCLKAVFIFRLARIYDRFQRWRSFISANFVKILVILKLNGLGKLKLWSWRLKNKSRTVSKLKLKAAHDRNWTVFEGENRRPRRLQIELDVYCRHVLSDENWLTVKVNGTLIKSGRSFEMRDEDPNR